MILTVVVLTNAGFIAVAVADDLPTTWTAHLRSTAYVYETVSNSDVESDFAPLYEHFDLSVSQLAKGRLNLRVSGRFGADLADEGAISTEDKLYVGHLGIRLDPMSARLRLGRQFLQEGANRHTLDGVWIGLRPSRRLQVHAWAGGEAPVARNFEASEFGDEAAYGIRLIGRVHPKARISGWFATRQNHGETTATPVGGELVVTPTPWWRGLLRGNYDAEASEFQRFDFLTNLEPFAKGPELTVQYVSRKPIIEAGSYFSRWNEELERVAVLRTELQYERENGFGGELEFFRSSVDDRSTNRFGLAFLAPHVRVGYSVSAGDSGEDSRWYGDVHMTLAHRVDLSAGAVYAEYALLEDAPDADVRELVTAYARARAEIQEGVRLLVELQSLENPFYKEDTRVLIGLDLAAGRGTSRYGVGTGGVH
jgi:hypothetical protein